MRLTALLALAAVAGILIAYVAHRPSAPPEPVDLAKIDIYVTPYFDSRGPMVNVGEFSTGLAATGDPFVQTIHQMKASWDRLTVEQMYVAAIRLYDLGYRDEAVHFFYVAQLRAIFMRGILDENAIGGIGDPAFELVQAWNAFQQLSGNWINGYAFGDVDRLQSVLRRVVEGSGDLERYGEVYPTLARVRRSQWRDAAVNARSGLEEFQASLPGLRVMIADERRSSGIDQIFDPLGSTELPRY